MSNKSIKKKKNRIDWVLYLEEEENKKKPNEEQLLMRSYLDIGYKLGKEFGMHACEVSKTPNTIHFFFTKPGKLFDIVISNKNSDNLEHVKVVVNQGLYNLFRRELMLYA